MIITDMCECVTCLIVELTLRLLLSACLLCVVLVVSCKMLLRRMPLLDNYENNFSHACIEKRTLLFYGRIKAAENLVLCIVPAAGVGLCACV